MSIKRWRFLAAAVMLTLVLGAAGTLAAVTDNIDDVVEQVRRMRESGASDEDVARFVAGTVDSRMTMGNAAEGDVSRTVGWWAGGGDGPIFDRWARFEREREDLGMGNIKDDGREYQHRARWAWRNQYGHCNEAAVTTYYILHEAGIQARILEAPGHCFTVMNLPPDVDPNDYGAWNDNSLIVDPWQNRSPVAAILSFSVRPLWGGGVFNAQQARDNTWIGHGGRHHISDTTLNYDNPEQARRWDESEGLGSLTVNVVREENGAPVFRAVVVAMGRGVGRNPNGRTDGAGSISFNKIMATDYTIDVRPPADQPLEEARSRITVPERGSVSLTVALPAVEPEPEAAYRGTLYGEGTLTAAGVAGTSDITVDIERGTFTGSCQVRAVMHGFTVAIDGGFAGSFSGTEESGTLEGQVELTQETTGPDLHDVTSVGGQLEGTLRGGHVHLDSTVSGEALDIDCDVARTD